MSGQKPADTLRRFNSQLSATSRSVNDILNLIREFERALQELDRQQGSAADLSTKSELTRSSQEIMNLKGAISRLEMELSDTQSKIDRLKF
jgi:chromosome segregation ATPase